MSEPPLADAIVREVAAAVGLAEGEEGVREVIRIVCRLGTAPTRTISRTAGLPVPIVAAVSAELRRRGVVAPERPTRLTTEGRRLFAGAGPASQLECGCPTCGGRGLVVPAEAEPLAHELAGLAATAPPARTELDQSHCTVETKLRRALLLHDAGALEGRRVLLLGDDDLTALAIQRLAEGRGPAAGIRELAVADLDPALLDYLRRHLRGAPFPVRLVEHDLRLPLPPALAGRFDTVLTDPPYTAAGAELFLSRAAAALRPRAGASVFLCYGPKPPAETLRLQEAIAAMGFVIRRLLPGFNDYLHAGILGGTSHLYHLVSTEATRPLVAGRHEGPLYTGESRAARPYLCASCGAVQRVGRGARWSTVDALRTDGCPECGATRFLPQPRGARRRDARPVSRPRRPSGGRPGR